MHNNAFHIIQGLTLFRLISWMKSAEMRSLVVIKISIVCTTLCLFYSAFPKFVMHKAFRILDSNHFALPVFHNILLILEANSELFICRLWNWWVGVVCIWRKAIESSNIPFGILMICSALFTRCTCAPKKFLMLVALTDRMYYLQKMRYWKMALWSRLKSLGGDQILAQFHGRQKSKWFQLFLSDTHISTRHKTTHVR